MIISQNFFVVQKNKHDIWKIQWIIGWHKFYMPTEYVFPDCSFDFQIGKDENPISEMEFVLNIIYISLFQLSEKNSKFKAEKEKGLFIISDLTYA